MAAPALAPVPGTGSKGGEFQAVLEGAIRTVENARQDSTQAVERFLSGEGEELHTTALAMQRAQMTFEMFMQVRNKVVQAYQEIMRMQT
jgi:flagellar hook-basal body complex protein FliE